jgi:hypothetical protein
MKVGILEQLVLENENGMRVNDDKEKIISMKKDEKQIPGRWEALTFPMMIVPIPS